MTRVYVTPAEVLSRAPERAGGKKKTSISPQSRKSPFKQAKGTHEFRIYYNVDLYLAKSSEGAHPSKRSFPQPYGIQWEILGQKLDEIPILQELARIRE